MTEKKITVALLSGGISSERDVSITSGNQVFEALDKVNKQKFDQKIIGLEKTNYKKESSPSFENKSEDSERIVQVTK